MFVKKILRISIIALFLVFAFNAGVIASKPSKSRVFSLPKGARQVSYNVFSLGKAKDKGRVVEGYAIVDYKNPHAKPGTECGNLVCEPGENARKCPVDCGGGGSDPNESSCYGFLARGAKWKNVEPWVVNTDNDEGLGNGFIFNNLSQDISKWENAAGVDILGGGATTSAMLFADTQMTDGLNEVYFADIAEPNVIGVTIVWGIFGGPPWARELVEWDQVYDDSDFDWSSSGEVGKMDFENIATHELGHSVGLDDLYTGECESATMYGYASEGEINKRTLEAGDIKGVQELYK